MSVMEPPKDILTIVLLSVALASLCSFFMTLYVYFNDRKLHTIPASLVPLTTYITPAIARAIIQEIERVNEDGSREEELKRQTPQKTGRRYIIVGGGGFLGGWIVVQLLRRGEDPKKIRILDLNDPVNFEVAQACERGLQHLKVDITDYATVEAAFSAPWANEEDEDTQDAEPDTTIFHTASNIRFWERDPAFLPRSTRVNVGGTENIIAASKHIGADVLVYTSSASVGVHSTRCLLWPWEKLPRNFIQVVGDHRGEGEGEGKGEEAVMPKDHYDHFSNYSLSKRMAEALVRKADKTPLENGHKGVLRTGAVRPGNGVYGPRGDILVGAYLVRVSNPTWVGTILQSWCYVENCALAHLLYERRLLDLIAQDKTQTKNSNEKLPDIGGQSFCIADPGQPYTFGNIYTMLETLCASGDNGTVKFLHLSSTLMLLIAYFIEGYYRLQFHVHSALCSYLSPKSWVPRAFAIIFPPLRGDIINLQPTLWNLTMTHLLVSDARARLPPEKGGLGYQGVWTTLEGVWKTYKGHVEERKNDGAVARGKTSGISLGGFGSWFTKKKAGKTAVGKKGVDTQLGVSAGPVEVLKAE